MSFEYLNEIFEKYLVLSQALDHGIYRLYISFLLVPLVYLLDPIQQPLLLRQTHSPHDLFPSPLMSFPAHALSPLIHDLASVPFPDLDLPQVDPVLPI